MNLKNTLFISLAAHSLLFGAAVAVAQYGYDFFGSTERVISVHLLGGGDLKGRARPAAPMKKSAPLVQAVLQSDEAEPAVGADVSSAQTGTGLRNAEDAAAGLRESGSAAAPQWRLIISALERAKQYPRLARERGVEGVVLVRFRMLPTGSIARAEIVKSSGSEILDAASLGAIRRAAPLPYVDGWVEVPVSYILQR